MIEIIVVKSPPDLKNDFLYISDVTAQYALAVQTATGAIQLVAATAATDQEVTLKEGDIANATVEYVRQET